jgi:glycosyltransferase involved in cell wall biosynthesis
MNAKRPATARITIIGPQPPPFGGASVHVLRLAELMRRLGHQVDVIPYTGYLERSPAGKLGRALRQWLDASEGLSTRPGDLVHFHYAHLPSLVSLAPWIGKRAARWAVTFHSVNVVDELRRLPDAARFQMIKLLARFDLIVCVRREIAEQLAELGLDSRPVVVMPAFLPPAPSEAAPERLPLELLEALDTCRKEGTISIACSAYYLGPGYGRDDLYGVEHFAGLLEQLDGNLERPVRLIVMVSHPAETAEQINVLEHLQRLADRLDQVDITFRFNDPLVPVLARCDTFVRPSREDGDSVAVREALALGVPVFASDVVARPEGVTLFDLEDSAVAAGKLADFLRRLPSVPATTAAETGADQIDPAHVEFTNRLLGKEDIN